MNSNRFFGYGSLVNVQTHDYIDPRPAVAAGWKRCWVTTQARRFAYLSVIRDEKTSIEGLVADVPNNDWKALDQREAAYERLDATKSVTLKTPGDGVTAIYAVPSAKPASSAPDCHILLSYLDVVIQGYLAVYGDQGVKNFVASTTGWTHHIFDDRASPAYPRHCRLTPDEIDLVDQILDQLNCVKVSA